MAGQFHNSTHRRSLGQRLALRLVATLLDFVWCAVLITVSPILIYRMLRYGKYRDGWREKFLGQLPVLAPATEGSQRYWFHAVSVGEVLLLRSLLPELRRRDPDAEIVLSTTTTTGRAVALAKFPDVTVCYFPLDLSRAVRRAIRNIQPTQIVLVELELWPNFLLAADSLGIPVSLINGRLSEKSFRGYSRIRPLMSRLLKTFRALGIQTSEYADRFEQLGASPESVSVTGSVKFDGVETNRDNGHSQKLRRLFRLQPDDVVFIAGSTQSPEERVAIGAWQTARRQFPNLRLILVPRHQERFDDVAKLVESLDLRIERRSRLAEHFPSIHEPTPTQTAFSLEKPVLLLDTLGELSACWGLADFAFVGGSLGNRGGQNMLEPAAYGAAVCFGPNTRNFRDVVENLLARDAARVVRDENQLATQLIEWLSNPDETRWQGQRAQQFVREQSGATARTISLLTGSEESDGQLADVA